MRRPQAGGIVGSHAAAGLTAAGSAAAQLPRIVRHQPLKRSAGPASLRAAACERNQGQVKHEFVLGTPAELKKHAALMAKFPQMEHDDPNAVSVEPGKTAEFAWTFAKKGSFDFACLVPGHFEAGMRGKIIVHR